MPNALSDVQATFTSLDSQYNMLLIACPTQVQRDALEAQYAAAQAAYQTCVNQTLDDDDPEVAALCTQLKAANAEIGNSEAEMGDISKVMNNIAQAITIGEQLAAKAGV